MTPFLTLVARDLLHRFGRDLSRVTVVFPNKRASLFLNDYLAAESSRPVWAPAYRTISELFRSLSPLRVADPIEAVCRLHRTYCEATHSNDTLDFFYGWGERLLADFDDVDKNMADTERLFRNLRDIKALDAADLLSEEQERVLQDFFQGFSLAKNSEVKQKFLSLWEAMLPIYRQFNASLAADGLAYEGALYRRVAEALPEEGVAFPPDTDMYAFVGFNVLDKVETALFDYLAQHGQALFYWDYDVAYAGDDDRFEAGTFLRRNLARFPSALPGTCFDNLRGAKDIAIVSAPTENAQARAVAPWLRAHLTADEKRTAVVMCNEQLLQPILHALPPEVREINVTKGFPLTHTPAFSLVEQYIKEQADEEAFAAGNFLDGLAARIRQAALERREHDEAADTTGRILAQLYAESYFRAYTTVGRLRLLAGSGWLDVGRTTLCRLLRQVLRQDSIPFHGEPAAGLQVMGVLETRCLDFENVLMLSVNEGNLPAATNDNSFIPYVLRRAFGLTTSEHRTAVYAYYFYRLVQRAHHVTMAYNCTADGLAKGEMSRFMTQMLVETDLPMRRMALSAERQTTAAPPPVIPKPADLPDRFRRLSPSAINTYLRCPLQFYFHHVARLDEPQPAPDVIEPNTFGSLFHRAAELAYRELTSATPAITREQLDRLTEAGGRLLVKHIRLAYADEGLVENPVITEVVRMYLVQLLENDKKLTPFEIVGMEKESYTDIAVPTALGERTYRVGGIIDRLDVVQLDGITTLRIVDYKTGGKPEAAVDVTQLVTPDKDHPHYVFQTFVYALTVCETTKWPIAPALFFVHQSAGDGYNPYIPFGPEGAPLADFTPLAAEFRSALTGLLTELMDTSRPFTATPFAEHCSNCPFASLCGF